MVQYYLMKFVRFIPLNALACALFIFGLPMLGGGPMWSNFRTVTEPCKSNWWTNILWVNNLYPANFDEKCLPWTFYMPVYMQLSLALPPLLWLYTIIPNDVVKIVYVLLLTLASLPATFLFVNAKTNGTVELNEAFLNDVFMNPLMHVSSFLLGMSTCLIYRRYMEDRATGLGGNSASSRTFEFIAMNVAVRYPLYLVALGLIVSPVIWMNQLVMG